MRQRLSPRRLHLAPWAGTQSRDMKTSSFVSTGSASSQAIMWEHSCFHQICELPIMWERSSSAATRSGRREIRHPSPAENLLHDSGTLATARLQSCACTGSMAGAGSNPAIRASPSGSNAPTSSKVHVRPVGLVSYAPRPSRSQAFC